MARNDDHHHAEGEPQMESITGPVVLALLVFGGLAYWLLTRPQTSHEPGHGAAVEHATPSPHRTPEAPPPRPRPAPAPSPPANAPVLATPTSPDCTASITTDPPGADVFWGPLPLGKTPIPKAAIPCGPAHVKVKHPIYSDIERDVTAVQGVPFNLTEKLQPGHARLELTSTPPGASFEVNGKPTSGVYEGRIGDELKVKASLPGHKPAEREVTLTTRRMSLAVELEPDK